VHGEKIEMLVRTVNLSDKVKLLRRRGLVPTEDTFLIIYSPDHLQRQGARESRGDE